MERETPVRRRAPLPLRVAARECQHIPSDLAEKDASVLNPSVLAEISLMESWRDIKALLQAEASGFIPTESPVETLPPVRNNRAQPLGGSAAEDWLGSVTDSEKLAATCKLSNNMLAYHLLTGRGLPDSYRFRDLGAALKDLSAQLLEWPETTIGTRPRLEKLDVLPRMSADDVLRSIKGKLSTSALLLSRFSVVPMVTAYTGVTVFERDQFYYLRIDNAEFKLGRDFVPDLSTAREILRHWERTGGSRHEIYELTPAEEVCIPMVMGLVQYRNSAGVHRFSVTTPPVQVSRMIPSVHTALTDATELVMKFQELLEGWTPPAQFGQDHIPLFAEVCRLTKVDWDALTLYDSREQYLSYYDQALATLESPGSFTIAEVKKYSLIERADQLLKNAADPVTRGETEDMLNAFKVPEAKVGPYTFTSDPVEVMGRLNLSRDTVRNTYDQREKLFRGNTYPGLPFASPDGVSTYLKVREVLNRLYGYRPAHRQLDHVLMGVGYTLAMQQAFPKNTTFCDIEAPKLVAKHVPVTIANALSMRCSDGSLLDISGKVYISDVYGGPLKPAEHYQQIDTVIAGRPACGAIKCFLGNPAVIHGAVQKLSRNYCNVFYCGVTKAHTGEFFICFTDLKAHEAEMNKGTDAKLAVFLALHSVRTDLANYFYNGHVRAGVMDFSKFKRIDAVLQRHGAAYVGKAWSRTVAIDEIRSVTGRKERAGVTQPTESMTLAELAALEHEAEQLAMARAASESATLGGESSGSSSPPTDVVRVADLGGTGGENEPLHEEGEMEDSSYGTNRYGKKGKSPK